MNNNKMKKGPGSSLRIGVARQWGGKTVGWKGAKTVILFNVPSKERGKAPLAADPNDYLEPTMKWRWNKNLKYDTLYLYKDTEHEYGPHLNAIEARVLPLEVYENGPKDLELEAHNREESVFHLGGRVLIHDDTQAIFTQHWGSYGKIVIPISGKITKSNVDDIVESHEGGAFFEKQLGEWLRRNKIEPLLQRKQAEESSDGDEEETALPPKKSDKNNRTKKSTSNAAATANAGDDESYADVLDEVIARNQPSLILQLGKDFDSLTATCKGMRKELAHSKTQLEGKDTEITNQSKQIDELEKTKSDLQTQLDKSAENLKGKDTKITNQSNKIDELTKKTKNLQTQLGTAKEKCDASAENLKGKDTEITNQSRQIDELKKMKSDLEGKCVANAGTIANQKNQIGELENKNADLQTENKKLEDEREAAKEKAKKIIDAQKQMMNDALNETQKQMNDALN